ncbi:S53 family peptidase [Amnibacterium endophyticum]|uniref:Peptidase S53 domain-containing protein n=1 Tax=Amnibacterium endophyticum TaxID=2109337 RepID=A0ABW4LEV1_9MICO
MRMITAGRAVALGALALTIAGATALPAQAATGTHPSSHVRVCGPPAKGMVACDAIRNDAAPVRSSATSLPNGYGPTQLQSAYGLTSTAGAGRTLAIIDAYDAPTAAKDLAVYRTTYGLPGCAGTPTSDAIGTCTFKKVNQTGGTRMPKANAGWAQETSLDLDMASAICPNCSILLVEADSASLADLSTAVTTAVRLGATVVSNSYGGSEPSASAAYDSAYSSTKAVITASTGDGGYGVSYPASAPGVIAVGGTSLTMSGTTRVGETAWSGAGSGCSTAFDQPSWQGAAVGTACGSKRAVADVSAVADPSTGVAVYDSTRYQGRAGWMVFGGTSASSPIIAGTYALAGGPPADGAGAHLYANTSSLHDVSGGSNGSCSTVAAQLCTAGTGWDGPTGLGTPNGLGAF